MKEKIQHQPFQGWLSLIKQRRLSISSPSLKDFKCNFVVVMPLNAISCPIFPINFQLISKSLEVIMTLNAILLWILVMLFLYTLSLPFFLIINFIRLILNLCVLFLIILNQLLSNKLSNTTIRLKLWTMKYVVFIKL